MSATSDTAWPWRPGPAGVLLFDAQCPLCQRSRLFLEQRAPGQGFDVVPLRSEAGRAWLQWCGRDPDDRSTVVLVTADGCQGRSAAILGALRQTDRLGRALAWMRVVPRPVRDGVYGVVSKARNHLQMRMPPGADKGLIETVAEGRRVAAKRAG